MAASGKPNSFGKYVLEGTKLGLDFFQDFADGLPGPVKGVVGAVRRIITISEEIGSNRQDCKMLTDHAAQLAIVVGTSVKKANGEPPGRTDLPEDLSRKFTALQRKLDSIAQELETIRRSADPRGLGSHLKAFMLTKDTASTIKSCNAKLEKEMKEFQVELQIEDAIRLCEVQTDVAKLLETADGSKLAVLPRARSAAYPPRRFGEPQGCLEGTRVDLLGEIRDWIRQVDEPAPPIFWLNGMAGTGKSTVAYSVAREAEKDDSLGACFCFSRTEGAELANPKIVFTTLAYQLAQFDRRLIGPRIIKALTKDPDYAYAAINVQWNELIVRPLLGVREDRERVVLIVLDALDECEEDGAAEILELILASASRRFPFHLKFFITSRPELHIRTMFQPSTYLSTVILHEIASSDVQADIRHYLSFSLSAIPTALGLSFKVSAKELDALTSQAGILFLVAAMSARFIGDKKISDPRGRLNILLRSHSASGLPSFREIDALYSVILKSSIPDSFDSRSEENSFFSRLRKVLAMTVLLREPLPIPAVERLAALNEGDVHAALNLLHSVIIVPSVNATQGFLRVCHPSFADFLSDTQRCPNPQLFINVLENQIELAMRCFQLLGNLKKGVRSDLNLTISDNEGPAVGLDSSKHIQLPSEVEYSCRQWATHVCRTNVGDEKMLQALQLFLEQSLMGWIDIMTLLGAIRRAIDCITVTMDWMRKSPTSLTSSRSFSLLNDSHRLILANVDTLSQSPSALYRSVIPFIPRGIELSKYYAQDADGCVKVIQGRGAGWPALSHTLRAHSKPILSLAFSPDDTQIASSSDDGTICFWDKQTTALLSRTHYGTDPIASIAFSPDSQRLASGSADTTVLIWDAVTYNPLLTLSGHTAWVWSVAWSPDGARLASVSSNHTLRLWNGVTGVSIVEQRRGRGVFHSVAFSADSTKLATGSSDGTIQIWNGMTGMPLLHLEGHVYAVLSLAWSPDSATLASGSHDRTVCLWNGDTGARLSVSRDHESAVRAVAFAPDGKRVASGSEDKTIRFWNASSGTFLSKLRSYTDAVYSLSFSPDGRVLASGSNGEGRIHIWDSVSLFDPRSHTDSVTDIRFSPDGTRLTSTSSDGTVCVWDTIEEKDGPLVKLRVSEGRPSWSADGRSLLSPLGALLWHSDTREGHPEVVRAESSSSRGRHPSQGAQSQTENHILSETEWGDIPRWDGWSGNHASTYTQAEGVRLGKATFTIEGGALYVHFAGEGSSHKCCTLPSSLYIRASTLAVFDNRVAFGCEDGKVVILSVSL